MPTGMIVIDKPQEWTSMDVCAKLRGVFGERHIGHAGTLDPMATGVLPVFVGRATKAVTFAESGEKEYIAALRLGLTTNTQDIFGETLTVSPATCSRADVEAVLPRFRGQTEQIPPMYSAVKRKGKKLYELARKGIEVERAPRSVTVFALELLEERTDSGDFLLRVRCSKGVYIRTLCHDIGHALGCGGCMAALRRVSACGFSLSDAKTLEQVVHASDPVSLLRPIDTLFHDRPALTVNAKEEERLRHGGTLRWRTAPDGEYRVYGVHRDFLLLGQVRAGRLTSIKNFFET